MKAIPSLFMLLGATNRRLQLLKMSALFFQLVLIPANGSELTFEENFSGYATTSVLGQNALAHGATGSWTKRYSTLQQNYSFSAVGLSYGSLVTAGSSLRIDSSSTSVGTAVVSMTQAARNAANPASGSTVTLWLSFLVKHPTVPGGTLRIGFLRDSLGSSALWGPAVVARSPGGFGSRLSSAEVTGGTALPGATCFYLTKISLHNSGSGTYWTSGTVTTWQYANAELPLEAPTSGGITANVANNANDRRIEAFGIQPGLTSGGYLIDEIRLGSTFDSVVPRVLVYETFQDYANGSLAGQESKALGGAGIWSKRYSSLAQDINISGSGLPYGEDVSFGGSVVLGSSSTSVGAVVMPLSLQAMTVANPTPGSSKTLWMSFLLQTPSSPGGTLQIGLGRDSSGNSPLWGAAVIARSPSGYGSRLNTVSQSSGAVPNGTTSFYLAKIDLNNAGLSSQWTSGIMQTWRYENGFLPETSPTSGGVTTSVSANTSDRRLDALILQPGSTTGGYVLDDLRLATSFSGAVPGGVLQARETIIRYPASSGIIDITQPPYNAVGDGVTDNTNAIRKAITNNVSQKRFIYFPKGVYLVSDSLEWKRYAEFGGNGDWGCNLSFIGEERDGTVIRLKDSAAGFGNPSAPKAVIFTANDGLDKTYFPWQELGAGNDAFRNHIRNLTVDTGSGNAGAVAIDYHGHNYSSIEAVTIQSGDGLGVTGLSITRPTPGPLLVRDLEVIGFDRGVDVGDWGYSLTFEHLTLIGQNLEGFRNSSNVVAIRGLSSINSGPAIVDTAAGSLLTIIDAQLVRSAGSTSQVAIAYSGDIFARNISVSGYSEVLRKGATAVAGPHLVETHSRPHATVHNSPNSSLNLPVEETPSFHDNNLANWVDVRDFGAVPNDNISDYQAIQNAIDSSITNPNITTLVFGVGLNGNSFYETHQPIKLRGNIRKIVGMNSTLYPRGSSFYAAGDLFKNPVIDLSEATAGPVFIEDIAISSNSNRAISVEHDTPVTLIIKSSQLNYRSRLGAGTVFLQDVTGGHYFFTAAHQKVFARQLNPEGTSAEKIVNEGAEVWILGLKTERTGAFSVIRNANGGKLEILGALHYPLNTIPSGLPMVRNEGGFLSMNYRTAHWTAGTRYETQVEDTQNGLLRLFNRSSTYDRSGYGPGGSIVTLYTSQP